MTANRSARSTETATHVDISARVGEPIARDWRAAAHEQQVELEAILREVVGLVAILADRLGAGPEHDVSHAEIRSPMDPVTAESIVFGDLLRQTRTLRGMSQRQLAIRADLDPGSVNRIEHDRRQPRVETVVRLTRALGYSLDHPTGRALLAAADVPTAFVDVLAPPGSPPSNSSADRADMAKTLSRIESWLNANRRDDVTDRDRGRRSRSRR